MSNVIVSVDLRPKFGPARDQGARPTCLAFATTDAHAAARPSWSELSCEYLFYHAQKRDGRPPHVGATLQATLDAVREDGQPNENGWPYLASVPADVGLWRPPSDVGGLYARNGDHAAAVIDEIIARLTRKQAVVLLLKLSNSFFAPTPEAIVDPALGEAPESAQRHAVVAVGHGIAQRQKAILVRNSWGPAWGDAGHAWLTQRFLADRLFATAILKDEVDVSARSVAA